LLIASQNLAQLSGLSGMIENPMTPSWGD
jgi:hypothetical protein